MTVEERDRRFHARGEPPVNVQVKRSQGSYVFDASGRKYIDFFMGWCVGNFGWRNPPVRAAIRRWAGPEYVSPPFLYRGWPDLAEMLVSLAPGTLTKCYRATGGTEAVDIALQLAMSATGRRKFVSLEESYHGNSVATRSVASSEYARDHGGVRSQQVKASFDGRAAERIETLLKRRDVAAFIMEPVVINLGVLVPGKEFMTHVAGLCRKYGTLFIADEVATGFGRTGKLFASEHFDLEPDIMCLGKAISGGHAGLGATIATDKVARDGADDVGFWSTYGWHPLAVETAIANLNYVKRNKTTLLRGVEDMGRYFRARLGRMQFKRDAEIRAKGLAIAIDVGDAGYASRVQEKCRKAGLLVSADEKIIELFPALTISRADAERGLDLLEESL